MSTRLCLQAAGAGDADPSADDHGPGKADVAGAADADAGDLDAEVAALGAPDPDGDPGTGASAEEGPSSEDDEEAEEEGAARGARVGAKRSAALAGLPQGYADTRVNPARAAVPELGEGVGWGDEDEGASGEGLRDKGPDSGGAAAEAAAEAPLTKRQRKRQKLEQEARLRAAELRQLEAPAPQSAADFEKLVRAHLHLNLQPYCFARAMRIRCSAAGGCGNRRHAIAKGMVISSFLFVPACPVPRGVLWHMST